MRKFFKEMTIFILGVYVLFTAYMYAFQRNYIYFPSAETFTFSAPATKINVKTADGLNIKGTYIPPLEQMPVILFFHGNKGTLSSRTHKSDIYKQQGYGVLMAEYRGYGGNAGKPTEEGLYSDARAYIDWLVNQRGVSLERIVLYGESLGTGVVVQMATEYEIKAIILEAAYSSALDVASKTYFLLPLKLMMKDQYQSIRKINKINAPLFMVHGKKDQVTPISLAEKLYAQASEPKELKKILQAGHNNLYDYGAGLYISNFLNTLQDKE